MRCVIRGSTTSKRVRRPRPRKAQPLPYCAAWDLRDRGMAARFSGAVETGRLWQGQPEQARVWIDNTLTRTLLLGFDKANLSSTGRATTGRVRPARFRASVQPFYYDLSESGQVRALQGTWRKLVAYAAGFQQRPHDPLYCLSLGQDRELSRIEYQEGRYEVLVASCYNQNYHASDDHRLFARNPVVRKAAWAEHLARYPVVRGYSFQIYRVSQDGHRLHVVQRGDRYELPFGAVRLLSGQIERLLVETWLYLQRHPEQLYRRHDQFARYEWLTRWQLFEPRPYAHLVGPGLNYTFQFVPESALFTRPELYRQAFTRLDPEGCYTREYLERLQLLATGQLCWPPGWVVTRFQAQQDLEQLGLVPAARQISEPTPLGVVSVPWHPLEEPELPVFMVRPAAPPADADTQATIMASAIYWLVQVFQWVLLRLGFWSRTTTRYAQEFLVLVPSGSTLPSRARWLPGARARGPPLSTVDALSPQGILFLDFR
jgi:hypothetical protein